MAAASSCTFVRFNDKGISMSGSGYVTATGEVRTVDFDVPQFTGIETWVSGDIRYTAAADGEPSVSISAPESILDQFLVEVEDGVLLIRSKDNKKWNAKVTITVQSSTLEKLSIRGAGDFNALSAIDTRSLDVDVKGAGDIDFEDVECEGDVSVSIEGAGDIGFRWLQCSDVKVDVKGAGDVRLAGKAQNADLSIKGAGDIDILNLTVTGNVSSSVAGVGSIKKN